MPAVHSGKIAGGSSAKMKYLYSIACREGELLLLEEILPVELFIFRLQIFTQFPEKPCGSSLFQSLDETFV